MDPKLKPIRLARRTPRGLGAWLTMTVLATAAVAVLLSACGGGGGGGVTPPSDPPPPTDGALQASQPGELLAYVKTKISARQSERAESRAQDLAFVTIAPVRLGSDNAAAAPPAGAVTASTAVDRSGTTVQESGVDEDDVLKSDGTLILGLAREPLLEAGKPAARLSVHRRLANGTPELAGRLTLNSDPEMTHWYSGMYLSADSQRAAVLGYSQTFYTLDFCSGLPVCTAASILPYPRVTKPTIALDLVSLANPTAPALAQKWRIDGQLVGSRLIGSALVLVTQHAPQLAVDAMPWNAPAAERDAQLARLTSAELLPTIRIDGGAAQPLVAETDCYVEPKNASWGIELTTITTVDLNTLQRRSRCFVGGSEALYMSPQALYLATTRHDVTPVVGTARVIFPSVMSTDIHKFSLGGGTVDYRGSGNVSGHLGWDAQSRSYRFSEHNGDLRVVSFTGSSGWMVPADAGSATAPPPSPATLSVLRERAGDKSLQTIATLPNAQRPAALGKPGEQVYAVRFVGDRGYVVTFRRIDPLYVLDLSNPADPRAMGELTTAGFSNYLFPAGSGLLLGVGRDADDRGAATGVKLALFDVADPARPLEKFKTTIGDAATQSALEVSRHGIDLFARGSQTRVVLPVLGWSSTSGARPFSLQRFEIDAAARTMVARSPLAAANLNSLQWIDLSLQRTLQIGEQVYFWDGSALKMYAW